MNVVQTPEGETYIPASQRPDGTWRKPRKVKDGYVPQEEVPKYQSKGKQWAANRPTYPVGLDPALIKASEAQQSNSIRVNAVRQAAQSAQSYPVGLDPELIKASEQVAKKKKKKQKSTEIVPPTTKTADTQVKILADPCPTPVDPAKRLRNLKKKLKEIIALEEKVSTKEVTNLDKDQYEKLNRKCFIEDEILALEMNSMKLAD